MIMNLNSDEMEILVEYCKKEYGCEIVNMLGNTQEDQVEEDSRCSNPRLVAIMPVGEYKERWKYKYEILKKTISIKKFRDIKIDKILSDESI